MILLLAFPLLGSQRAAAQTSSSHTSLRRGHRVGLGKVLTSANGGLIFGFDVDQNGLDGIVDDAVELNNGGLKSAIETFDIKTGKITKTVKKVTSSTGGHELVTFGIAGNDIGLVDEERSSFKNGKVRRNDLFYVLNPVSGNAITGPWTVPHPKGSVLTQLAANQATDTQVALVYRNAPNFNLVPYLYVTDLATNTLLKSIKLGAFEDNLLLQIAQDSTTNEAATFIDSYPGGPPPVNVVIDLKTGDIRTFNGFNNGPYGAGAISGSAIDSTTDILCTTTNLNAQVEFYNISSGKGRWAQLPDTGSGDELTSGTAVTNDSIHHLFLVAQPVSSTGGASAVYVYNEKGIAKETINGFSFNRDYPTSFGVKIAINPKLRIGWVNGADQTQLQQFYY